MTPMEPKITAVARIVDARQRKGVSRVDTVSAIQMLKAIGATLTRSRPTLCDHRIRPKFDQTLTSM